MAARAFAAALLLASTCAGAPDGAGLLEQARRRWQESPHGPMLERILPPTFEPRQLPEPGSAGASLMLRFCVQCHNLPNPAMHERAKWPVVFERMVLRMRGRGNMGELMKDMMAGVSAPGVEEAGALLEYLQKHAQRPLDPRRTPLNGPEAQSFRLACRQCHVLPDPRRHTAAEWPGVVARMQKNMEWMNRVVGNRHPPDEPQLRVEEINAFLRRYARRD